jgi:hypothetical protein
MAAAVATRSLAAWRGVNRADIRGSWLSSIVYLLPLLVAAQRAAASRAERYIARSLAAQGIEAAAAGSVVPASLAGVASDGRSLASLLYQPVIATLTALKGGAAPGRALALGQAGLAMIVTTQVSDAGRVADSVAMVSRPYLGGYTRMLSLPSCGRCVILAGKFYRWNTGFKRHPHCDCVHIPTHEDVAGSLTTNTGAAFRSMSTAEQDKAFTNAGAQAIRDGADMSRIVNARRGMETANVFGRELSVTTEAASRNAPRLMPESIYAIANGDRQKAIELLSRNGYLT